MQEEEDVEDLAVTDTEEDSVTEDAQAVGAPGVVTKHGAVGVDTSSAKPEKKKVRIFSKKVKALFE